jgi:hypothetical protein
MIIIVLPRRYIIKKYYNKKEPVLQALFLLKLRTLDCSFPWTMVYGPWTFLTTHN